MIKSIQKVQMRKLLFFLVAIVSGSLVFSQPAWHPVEEHIMTRWAKNSKPGKTAAGIPASSNGSKTLEKPEWPVGLFYTTESDGRLSYGVCW